MVLNKVQTVRKISCHPQRFSAVAHAFPTIANSGNMFDLDNVLYNVLHFPHCLYLVSKHVYSFRNILHLPDCLYLVTNYVYSLRIVLHLPYCLYLVPNNV